MKIPNFNKIMNIRTPRDQTAPVIQCKSTNKARMLLFVSL